MISSNARAVCYSTGKFRKRLAVPLNASRAGHATVLIWPVEIAAAALRNLDDRVVVLLCDLCDQIVDAARPNFQTSFRSVAPSMQGRCNEIAVKMDQNSTEMSRFWPLRIGRVILHVAYSKRLAPQNTPDLVRFWGRGGTDGSCSTFQTWSIANAEHGIIVRLKPVILCNARGGNTSREDYRSPAISDFRIDFSGTWHPDYPNLTAQICGSLRAQNAQSKQGMKKK